MFYIKNLILEGFLSLTKTCFRYEIFERLSIKLMSKKILGMTSEALPE
ncbi:MAG: hypothetical protein N3A61_02945 [Ignavibacteria bacterium]|nr:hypothetical protein [Ignavibacteria bacterium]